MFNVLQQSHTLMQILSFLTQIQVGLVTDHYLMRSVQHSNTPGIYLVRVPDVYAVEILTQQHAYAGHRTIHNASVHFMLIPVVFQTGGDVTSP